jgi:hypothetical protein
VLQLTQTYTFEFADRERVVIGPDPTVQNWAGHITDISATSDASQAVTPIPGTNGAVVGDTTLGAFNLTIEVLVTSADPAERAMYLRRLDKLSRAYNEDVTLYWTEADGLERRISGLRKSQFAPVGHNDGPAKKKVLSFVAPLPVIETKRAHVLELATSGSPVAGTGTVINAGSGPAYPELRLYGPFTAATVSLATGPSLTITRTLSSGTDYILVKTKPQERGVWLNGSTNVYSDLSWLTSTFFSVPPGTTDLTYTATGGTAGTSKLRAEWRSAWLL